MKRLFWLSMAFLGAVVLFIVGLASFMAADIFGSWSSYWVEVIYTYWSELILGIPFLIIGGACSITLGVMLVKHIRDIFKT